MRGVLETVKFEQQLPGDAAFHSNRREYIRHGLFSPFDSAGLSCRTGGGIGKVGRRQVPL
jgi:hypothetical protein